MKNTIARDQDYEIWVLFRQVTDVMHRTRDKELNGFGISWIQAAVLFTVKSIKGPATPAAISRWLFREPHTVSELLNRMKKEGLINKTKDLERKNQVRISLTKKGEKAYQQSRDMKVIHKILSCLSQGEKDDLKTLLGRLRSGSFGELGVKGELPFP